MTKRSEAKFFINTTHCSVVSLKRDNLKSALQEVDFQYVFHVTEKAHKGREPPPQLEVDAYSGTLTAASRTALAKYYASQMYLWNVLKARQFDIYAKRRAEQRRKRREIQRQEARTQPATDTLNLFSDAHTRHTVTDALNAFRAAQARRTAGNVQQHQGWPPKSAIFIGTVRKLFVDLLFVQNSLVVGWYCS